MDSGERSVPLQPDGIIAQDARAEIKRELASLRAEVQRLRAPRIGTFKTRSLRTLSGQVSQTNHHFDWVLTHTF